jgi:dTDP-4-dehydrorhamnose reductase
MSHVLILGSTGMLGSAVLRELASFSGQVSSTQRTPPDVSLGNGSKVFQFSASKDSLKQALAQIENVDFIINCIGVIKPYINDNDPQQRENAIAINGLFPYELNEWAENQGAKVIQIATDCVYSGAKGSYVESDKHDALDVYGKSKSLGESPGDSMMHLRVSIIGPEVGRSSSLLEWVRNQPKNAEIKGYTDHFWNGITTLHFAQIARGILEKGLFEPGVFHVLPKDTVSKFELVSSMATHLERPDITISPTKTGDDLDRTLQSVFPQKNQGFWQGAGYKEPPTIDEMVAQMIAWENQS